MKTELSYVYIYLFVNCIYYMSYWNNKIIKKRIPLSVGLPLLQILMRIEE